MLSAADWDNVLMQLGCVFMYFVSVWCHDVTCVITFASSGSLYTSSGKSRKAASSLLANWDNRLLMWVLSLQMCLLHLSFIPMWCAFIPNLKFRISFSISVITIIQFSLFLCFLIFCHQEGKDKSFLLEKLQNLQKSNPKKPKQKNQKKVCCWKYLMLTQLNINFYPKSCHQPHCKCPLAPQQNSRSSDDHPSGGQSNSNAMVQALLARQRLEEVEEEEERHSGSGVPVPSDTSTSSALHQAMLARQRAQDQDEDLHQMHDTHSSSSSALALAMQARQMSQNQERDEYFSTGGLSDGPPSALAQAMQARQRADEYGDADGLPSPVSSVMMQVMQARQRAEEAPQNPAPAGSSALIQAMLARQQAQNEYDDGYWTLS